MITLVITGSYQQFQDWCQDNDIDILNPDVQKFYLYANRPEHLRGRKASQTDIVFYGEYWKNPIYHPEFLPLISRLEESFDE